MLKEGSYRRKSQNVQTTAAIIWDGKAIITKTNSKAKPKVSL